MNANVKQLRLNVEELVYGYLNGQTDCGTDMYPNLTPEQWFDYCVPEIYNMYVKAQGSTWYRDGICDNLRFLGNDTIREVIVEIAKGEGLVA